MKKIKYLILFFIIMLVVIIYNSVDKYSTYDEFYEKTNQITSMLEDNYTILNKNLSDVYIVPYPVNVKNKWADTIGDAVDDNPIQSLKKHVYIKHGNGEIVSKIAINYVKEIKSKQYISLNRFQDFNNEMLNENYDFPHMYLTTIADKGVIIEIYTIAMNDDISDGQIYDIDKELVERLQVELMNN